jgi:hypothetical protein
MADFYENWDDAWTVTGVNAATVAANTGAETGAISNDGKLDTEVSVSIGYGATISGGAAKVYVLRDIDGTAYEAVADRPYGFDMPVTASTTHRRSFSVPASVSRFKVRVENPSGNSDLTGVTIRVKQAVGNTV